MQITDSLRKGLAEWVHAHEEEMYNMILQDVLQSPCVGEDWVWELYVGMFLWIYHTYAGMLTDQEGGLEEFEARFVKDIGYVADEAHELVPLFLACFNAFTNYVVPNCEAVVLQVSGIGTGPMQGLAVTMLEQMYGETGSAPEELLEEYIRLYTEFAMSIKKHAEDWKCILAVFFEARGAVVFGKQKNVALEKIIAGAQKITAF